MHIPTKVKEEYAAKRRKNELLHERRVAEIYERIPEISDVDSKKLDLAFELGMKAYTASGEDYESEFSNTKAELAKLDDLKSTLLTAHGYPTDYLEPVYDCHMCMDKGFLPSDGSMCACLLNSIISYNYASSDIDNGECFENFDLSVFHNEKQRRMMSKMYDFSLNYANTLPHPEPLNLIILGSTGLGKTYLLNCIAKRAIVNGLNVIKITSYNMFDSILKSIRSDADMPDYISCDLLAIDDLGSEPFINNITVEKLFLIINEREAQRKPTVIASNLSKDDLQNRYDERIVSRLLTPKYNTVVLLRGDDVRLL